MTVAQGKNPVAMSGVFYVFYLIANYSVGCP